MNHKGIELQFHWIFIMVAGALILTFFVTIAQKQYTLSTQKSEYQMVNALETVFSLVLTTPGLDRLLKISSPIEFKCTEYGCNYKVGSIERSFYNKLIFSAQKQEGDIKLWALDFDKPFRAATFLIISGSETKYYLVYSDENEADKLLLRIPQGVIEKVQTGHEQNIPYSGEQQTRFVYYKTNPGIISSSFEGKNVDAVELGQGNVDFYSYEDDRFTNTGSSQYSQEDTSVFAAMFSADKEMYEYQMKKLFKRLGDVTEVYKERTNLLQIDPQHSQCLYEPDKLDSIINLVEEQKPQNKLDFSQFNLPILELEKLNKRMTSQSCPEIY